MTAITRLHVTPFNESLLSIVLPPDFRAHASDVTFHTISTFPENNYGYLDLPVPLATRLKKRLHGSVVRGRKMRVEDARSRRKKSPIAEADPADILHRHKTHRPLKGPKRQESSVVSGMELSKDRKVKRGWTQDKDRSGDRTPATKKATRKNTRPEQQSLTGESECLFKTNIPPIKLQIEQSESSSSKKRKRNTTGQEAVVHEFQHTQHPPNEPMNESSPVSPVVENGRHEDQVQPKESKKVAGKAQKRKQRRGSGVDAADPDVTSVETFAPRKAGKDSRRGEASESSVTATDAKRGEPKTEARPPSLRKAASKARRDRETSHAGSVDDQEIEPSQVERLSISRSSSSPQPHVNTQPTSDPSSAVHPLEALFKRPHTAASQSKTPRKPHLELSTTFNFFEEEAEDLPTEDTNMLMPQTPFTQQDFRSRRQRSAAPTPDTALPGKTFEDILGGAEGEGSQSDSGEEGQVTSGATGEEPGANTKDRQGADSQESENVKWFYEQRGANRRSWQRERREATKGKKYRDRKEKR